MNKDLLYIMSFDGKDLISQEKNENGKKEIIVKNPYGFNTDGCFDSDIYTCTLPISMDLIELENYSPEQFEIYSKKDRTPKWYSKALVNLTFKQGAKMPIGIEDWKTKKVREELYNKGFSIDGIKYVEFKRSSSKAREGSTLFIKESLYNHMIEWSRLGLQFKPDEKIDIASLRAYESLTLSGLDISPEMKNFIEIKPEQILIIKSFIHHFHDVASVTEINNGEIVTNDKEIEFDNDIWDGQCLVDYTLFNKAKRSDKGMMLLRNRFFKACGFNTKLKYFFKSQHIDTVYDMFGNPHDAKDIKMVITPSCLKFLKFHEKFKSEAECYNYWLKNIDYNFGILKSEKPSHYNNHNQLSYQMINSMPLDEDDIRSLAEKEIEYIKLIQNDLSAFIEHISLDDKSNTRSFISELVKHNEDIIGTELYKDFKADTLHSYRKNVKRGKIKIADTDYCTICCDIYEMLLATTTPDNQFDMDKQLLKGYEIYTPRCTDDEKVVGFRNPHIATGNVLLATNKYCKQFDSFFNFTDNIVVINAIGCQIFDRLQGNDMDSDTVLLSTNPILIARAEECQNYLTPVNKIKGDKDKNKKTMTATNKSDIDYVICQNKIGEIVNLSQIFNSHYWHGKKNKVAAETLKKIYEQVSQLSSLSQIEIDKAKKFFDSINIISYTQARYRSVDDRPIFFKVIQKPKKNMKYNFYDCPMDYLQKVIDDITRAEDVDSIDIFSLFAPVDRTPNHKQILEIKELVKKADKKIKAIRKQEKRTQDDEEKIIRIETDLVDKIRKYKLSVATMQDIIRRIYSEKSKDNEITEYKMLLLKTVATANVNSIVNAFIAKEPTEELEEVNYWNN